VYLSSFGALRRKEKKERDDIMSLNTVISAEEARKLAVVHIICS